MLQAATCLQLLHAFDTIYFLVLAMVTLLNFAPVKCMAQTTALTSTLHSTKYGVKFAYASENVTFTCVTRGSSLMAWSSDEYIGSDGLRLEFVSIERKGINRTAGLAVATLVESSDNNGEITLVSQLRITIYSMYQISSITCHNIGIGTVNTTTFRMAGMDEFFTCMFLLLYANNNNIHSYYEPSCSLFCVSMQLICWACFC